MSRNKIIGIVAACIVVVIVVVMTATDDLTPPAEANSPVSDFLTVGESYEAHSSGPHYETLRFTVVEIINDKWILVDPGWGETIWLNTDQLVFIDED
jgi:hypothetical protein